MCTWPPAASSSIGPVPLYGTLRTSILAARASSSQVKCWPLPWPAVPHSSLPGLALAQAMSSGTVFTPSDGWTTNSG